PPASGHRRYEPECLLPIGHHSESLITSAPPTTAHTRSASPDPSHAPAPAWWPAAHPVMFTSKVLLALGKRTSDTLIVPAQRTFPGRHARPARGAALIARASSRRQTGCRPGSQCKRLRLISKPVPRSLNRDSYLGS